MNYWCWKKKFDVRFYNGKKCNVIGFILLKNF